jgi:beta-glucosidase-like glycosyl hydrolase
MRQDPYLGYILSQPAVKAIQAEGVVANAKHWVVNSQETDRMSTTTPPLLARSKQAWARLCAPVRSLNPSVALCPR